MLHIARVFEETLGWEDILTVWQMITSGHVAEDKAASCVFWHAATVRIRNPPFPYFLIVSLGQ